MQNVDLDKLDAAYKGTSQGEWSVVPTFDDGTEPPISSLWTSLYLGKFDSKWTGTVTRNSNASWAAEIHNSYPALAAELRALRELSQHSADIIDDWLENRPPRHRLGNLYSRLIHALGNCERCNQPATKGG